MRRIVLLAVSYSAVRGSEVDDVTFEPAYGYWDDDSYGYMIDDGFCAWQCDPEYISDGECDEMCNVPECEFDGVDCFHGYGECYTQADGSDYRGAVNVTEGGLTCQAWSQQWPQRHDRIHTNYPHGGLGGHNSCRNPDGETGPWCYTTDPNVRWQHCTIPPPQGTCAGHHAANRTAPPPRPASDAGSGEQSSSDMYDDYNMDYPYPPWELSYDIFPVVFAPEVSSPIELNTMITGSVEEHTYVFYEVEIPQSVQEVKVVVVPEEGDPDLYVSFDNPFPTGANYTFLSDNYGVEEWTLGRYNYLFCGAAGTEAACTMYLSILAYDEHSTFSLVVYGVEEASADDAPSTLCAPGCEWLSLGDGTCNQQCDVEECFFDRGDCACDSAESADCTDGCPVSCKPEWIGDHYCDEACFRASCQWDKHDCLKKGETPCADDCLPTSLGDGECDAACNVESCNFDIDDCFHNNNECYERQDGADYRGKVATTESGYPCQRWSDQSPQQHTRTAQHYPRSGLGGHNFCRNPDREERPWCYVADKDSGKRWDYCAIGEPSNACVHPPPPAPPPAVEGAAAMIEVIGAFCLGLFAILMLLYCRRLKRKRAMKSGGFTQYGGHDDGVLGTGVEIKPVVPESAAAPGASA